MKKWLYLVLLFSVSFIVSCESGTNIFTGPIQSGKEVIRCGDDICDESEGCSCLDCENDPRCFDDSQGTEETQATVCNKGDIDCCGNDKCESGERCNLETFETVCPEDCVLTCPASLIVGNPKEENLFYCTGNCDFNNGKFVIRGNSIIQANIENSGERSSGIVTSKFTCTEDGSAFAKKDNDGSSGITIRDYFENEQDELRSINSRVTGNNIVTYSLEINTDNLEKPVDIRCSIRLTSIPYLQSTNYIDIKILQ